MDLREQVETILKDVPETRNSDITLMIQIWKRFYPGRLKKTSTGDLGVYLKDLYDLPREDNIKRIRAQFNAEYKYLPTDYKIMKQRRINEEMWRRALGYVSRNHNESF